MTIVAATSLNLVTLGAPPASGGRSRTELETLAREAAAELEGAPEDAITIDLEAREEKFSTLSDRLGDTGLNGGSIKAWERATSNGTRRVYH